MHARRGERRTDLNDHKCPYYDKYENNQGPLENYFYCSADNWDQVDTPGQTDPEDYRYICYGDSGTGLMSRRGNEWDVAGVVSWGEVSGSGRGCGVYPESFVKLNAQASIDFIKPYLKQYRAAANMPQCPGWE